MITFVVATESFHLRYYCIILDLSLTTHDGFHIGQLHLGQEEYKRALPYK